MSTWTRNLPFPQNMSPGQMLYIEAVHQHRTIVAASAHLGISQSTMRNRLINARMRAGVDSTKELVAKYLAHTKAARTTRAFADQPQEA